MSNMSGSSNDHTTCEHETASAPVLINAEHTGNADADVSVRDAEPSQSSQTQETLPGEEHTPVSSAEPLAEVEIERDPLNTDAAASSSVLTADDVAASSSTLAADDATASSSTLTEDDVTTSSTTLAEGDTAEIPPDEDDSTEPEQDQLERPQVDTSEPGEKKTENLPDIAVVENLAQAEKNDLQVDSADNDVQVGTPSILELHQHSGLTDALHPRRQKRSSARNVRRSLRQRRDSLRARAISVMLLLIILLAISVPLIVSVSYGIRIYQTYTMIRTDAYSGMNHLLDLKQIFTASKTSGTSASGKSSTTFLDAARLARAKSDLRSAHSDFQHIQFLLDNTRLVSLATQMLPQYQPLITTAHAATQIGIDATSIGQQIVSTGETIAPRFQGPLLSDSTAPLILPSDLTLVQSTLDNIQPQLKNIEYQSHFLQLSALPISIKQRTQVQQALTLLPQIVTTVYANRNLLNLAGWLLGVDQSRTFLVQTMDRAELRATGGFTGQYGELAINGGRVAPFSLTNIALLEYSASSTTYGQLAPEAYRSWWPFANWGLRDSNLSADFPTSAQMAIERYKAEVHHAVDGVVTFTPTTIEHVLEETGPISIPLYQETITAQNLESKLHYYQLSHDGIVKEKAITHVDDDEQAPKQFTSTLAHTLIDHFRHASLNELIGVGKHMLQDLQTRDLQLYFTNPQVENLLVQYNDAGQMDRSTSHDGLYVVQMNVSVNKATQYVQTLLHDTVTLDSTGGATHSLQMRLIYNQTGPVYGDDTYHDYVRIYVPPAAHYLSGNGFDQGSGEESCASPLTDVGPRYAIGPPTNMRSDEPARAMFAGYVVIPKNCSTTINVSWYVPSTHQGNYSLLFQRQAGTNPDLQLTINPPVENCSAGSTNSFSFASIVSEDRTFRLQSAGSAQHGCG